jgi:hypothetical protein
MSDERSKGDDPTNEPRSKHDAPGMDRRPHAHAIAEATVKALMRYPDHGLADTAYPRLGREVVDAALDRLLLTAQRATLNAAKAAEVEARCACLTDLVERAIPLLADATGGGRLAGDARAALDAFAKVAAREAELLAALRQGGS